MLFGYVDDAGKMVIPAIYEHAYCFTYGFAIVKKNDKWGAIDTNGKVVIPFKYDGLRNVLSASVLYNLIFSISCAAQPRGCSA